MKHDPESTGHPPDKRPMEVQPQWRQDFPIDVPQDNYVARRDFTKFMVLTSFAFVIGQLWIGIKNTLRKMEGKMPRQEIAGAEQLTVGQALTFAYPHANEPCLIVRTDENTYVAYSQKCTHLACAVLPDPENNSMHCPCHEGYFELATGKPTAGPPRRPLPRVVLEVSRGRIFAVDMEVTT